MAYRIALLLILVLMAACSTLRQPLQPEAKANADNMLAYARRLENKGSDAAKDAYRQALTRYRSFAGIEGEMWCLAGIARSLRADGDSQGRLDTLAEMDGIVRDIDPGLDYITVLTRLQILAGNNAWAEMLPLAQVQESYPALVKMQILSYGVQASAFTGKPDAALAAKLSSLYQKAERKAHKKGAEQALGVANAAYSLACHYYVLGDMEAGLKHVNAALKLDYLYGNFRGQGYDYWLLGRICSSRGDATSARAAFLKAERIFAANGESDMLPTIKKELQTLIQGGGQ